jgi:hypothetical protein
MQWCEESFPLVTYLYRQVAWDTARQGGCKAQLTSTTELQKSIVHLWIHLRLLQTHTLHPRHEAEHFLT